MSLDRVMTHRPTATYSFLTRRRRSSGEWRWNLVHFYGHGAHVRPLGMERGSVRADRTAPFGRPLGNLRGLTENVKVQEQRRGHSIAFLVAFPHFSNDTSPLRRRVRRCTLILRKSTVRRAAN